MAETTLHIAGRQYDLRCRDGEEAHLAHLAGLIERKARLAQQSTPGLTEVRTLLFAALFLADELNDMKREMAGRQEALPLDGGEGPAVLAIEVLTARLEKLSDRLAAPPPDA
ncbi:cell division protein ZapA [Sphingobium faniae]|nr:cell division protein ZapA [Sphingobium faniae]